MERLKIAVGCPVRSRAWIFPQWVDHVRAAFDFVDLTPYWVFNIGIEPHEDDGTFKLATDLMKEDGGMWCETIEESPYLAPGKRRWGDDGYHRMVGARNRLLELVRAAQPDYFLSADSDILLHPLTLLNLLADLENGLFPEGLRVFPGAVGGKAYLSPSTSQPCPTYGNLLGSGLVNRQDSDGLFLVDAIMALKLMGPDAYNIDYEFAVNGEDIGWSMACRRAGIKLAWDGRVASKHVMTPEQLETVDKRIGW